MKHVCLTLALLAATVELATGQTDRPDLTAVTNELRALCNQVGATEQAEEGILQNHKSAAVTRALASESSFWQLITDPSTPYRDRMVAARQGGGLVGLERLPELWKAQADLDRPSVPWIGSPCAFLFSANLTPLKWVTRHSAYVSTVKPQSILFMGQQFAQPIEYPVTQADRDNAPWLWQMEQMLPVLMNAVATYYAQPDRYPAMAGVAWNWRTSDWWEARVREGALCRGPRNVAWLENIVRLALEHNPAEAAPGAAPNPTETGAYPVTDLYVGGNDSYHFEELVHAAQIVILQRTNRRDVATQAAFQIAQLATWKDSLGPDSPLKPLQTATSILALARWAANRKIDAWGRYITYAGAICQMVNDPPYRPNPQAHESTGQMADALGAFDVWFSKQRPQLERAAAAERSHLNALAAELHQTIE